MKLRLVTGLMLIVCSLSLSMVSAQDMTYTEAPMLAERVAAGELPKVEDRLPVEPEVVAGLEIGQYGGTWRVAANGVNDTWTMGRTFAYEPLIRWAPDWSGVVPGVAKDWEVSEDGTTFTFALREGMKWSDGVPFTSADIMFWYEDVAMNTDISSAPPDILMAGGEPAVVTAPDDYTVVFQFAEPNGLFLRQLPFPGNLFITMYARHYFEQFHATYNENVAEEATAAGFETWPQYFESKGGALGSVGRWDPAVPVLYAFMPAEAVRPDTSVIRFERNPYFWRVDPEGQQYPYLDYVNITVFQDSQTMLLEAAAGQLDMQERHIGAFGTTNKAFLFESRETGDFDFFNTIVENSNAAILRFNLNHENPVLNEIFNNKDFRIGLSHAIDRQELIDVMYVGQGIPHQAAPLPDTPFYHEQLATQYTEFDVDLANQYLDQAGYAERDSEGYRLGPDGNRISFTLAAVESFKEQADIVDIVANYWEEVGIEVLPRVLDRNNFEARVNVLDFDVAAYPGHAGIDVLSNPNNYFPYSATSHQALRWAAWYNGDERTIGEVEAAAEVEASGDNASEPFALDPQDEQIYRQWELWDLVKTTPDAEQQAAYVMELLDITADQFYVIGISTPPNGFGVVSNAMRNVPDTIYSSWTFASPGPVNVYTFFKVE